MKKDRNSFFSGYGYGPIANNMGMGMNNFVPNQAVSASNQFYAGPAYQDNGMNNTSGMNNNMYTDIDSRLSKVERRLSRIEARLNKLEGDSSLNYGTDYNSSTNDMYMV